VAAGAHFLSDALTSILLVWLGFLILQRLLPLEPSPGASAAALTSGSERAVVKAGAARAKR
jgi:hypothetical protein